MRGNPDEPDLMHDLTYGATKATCIKSGSLSVYALADTDIWILSRPKSEACLYRILNPTAPSNFLNSKAYALRLALEDGAPS
jgi:hypothetical protein